MTSQITSGQIESFVRKILSKEELETRRLLLEEVQKHRDFIQSYVRLFTGGIALIVAVGTGIFTFLHGRSFNDMKDHIHKRINKEITEKIEEKVNSSSLTKLIEQRLENRIDTILDNKGVISDINSIVRQAVKDEYDSDHVQKNIQKIVSDKIQGLRANDISIFFKEWTDSTEERIAHLENYGMVNDKNLEQAIKDYFARADVIDELLMNEEVSWRLRNIINKILWDEKLLLSIQETVSKKLKVSTEKGERLLFRDWTDSTEERIARLENDGMVNHKNLEQAIRNYFARADGYLIDKLLMNLKENGYLEDVIRRNLQSEEIRGKK